MKRRTDIILHVLFFVIVIIELIGRWIDNVNLEYPVKPLIMVWIAVYFLLKRRKKNFTIPVLLAFFFSWVGDVMLMNGYRAEYFFYGGVGGFFVAQLIYIYVFTRYNESGGGGFVRKRMYFGLIFLAYLAGFLFLIFKKGVDENGNGIDLFMKIILTAYGASLLGMSMMALNRKGRVGMKSFLLVFIGSVLFVLSDSMIALYKFAVLDIPRSGFWIMLAYIPAQYFIMRGLSKEKKVN